MQMNLTAHIGVHELKCGVEEHLHNMEHRRWGRQERVLKGMEGIEDIMGKWS